MRSPSAKESTVFDFGMVGLTVAAFSLWIVRPEPLWQPMSRVPPFQWVLYAVLVASVGWGWHKAASHFGAPKSLKNGFILNALAAAWLATFNMAFEPGFTSGLGNALGHADTFGRMAAVLVLCVAGGLLLAVQTRRTRHPKSAISGSTVK